MGSHLELRDAWVIYINLRVTKTHSSRDAYNASLQTVGEFSTIDGFWKYINSIDVLSLPRNTNIRFFKKGITPEYETDSNKYGGRICFNIPQEQILVTYWESILTEICGSLWRYYSQINGACLCVREQRCSFQLWVRSSDPKIITSLSENLVSSSPQGFVPDVSFFKFFKEEEVGTSAPVEQQPSVEPLPPTPVTAADSSVVTSPITSTEPPMSTESNTSADPVVSPETVTSPEPVTSTISEESEPMISRSSSSSSLTSSTSSMTSSGSVTKATISSFGESKHSQKKPSKKSKKVKSSKFQRNVNIEKSDKSEVQQRVASTNSFSTLMSPKQSPKSKPGESKPGLETTVTEKPIVSDSSSNSKKFKTKSKSKSKKSKSDRNSQANLYYVFPSFLKFLIMICSCVLTVVFCIKLLRV
ncbi:hypothetical protein GEMRC1_009776 [Eukaryota sp. GEM-RC1]